MLGDLSRCESSRARSARVRGLVLVQGDTVATAVNVALDGLPCR